MTTAVGAVDDPCAFVAPMPADVAAWFAEATAARTRGAPAPVATADQLAAYREWQAQVREQDFAHLCRYAAANAALPPPGDRRVVYFGDSCTELWGLYDAARFAGDVHNRGISGQTTLQMLGRFRADVIDLKPRLVHILAGANDVAGNTGPTSLDRIVGNLTTMIELAVAHDIRVLLAMPLPCAGLSFQPHLRPAPLLRELADRLRRLAAERGLATVDYHTPFGDAGDGFDPRYSDDGLHPNAAGYRVMAPIADAAIARVG